MTFSRCLRVFNPGKQKNMQLGYIGLGKMGSGMVKRLSETGRYEIVAYDPSEEARRRAEDTHVSTVESIPALVEKLSAPRTIWLMVPHQAVEKVLDELTPLLSEQDTIIDGGNSPWKETVRRGAELDRKGVRFLDAGVSGGPGGARAGACVMIGGRREDFEKYEELFRDIAAPDSYGYMGRIGAGHFVKMVHNGIEYGMMQAIAEGFTVLKKSDFDLDLSAVVRLYNHNSVIESRLTKWLEEAFEVYGEDLEDISGSVAASGEALWTVQTAKELGVEVKVIEESLDFRTRSQKNPSYTGKILSALRNRFGGHKARKE